MSRTNGRARNGQARNGHAKPGGANRIAETIPPSTPSATAATPAPPPVPKPKDDGRGAGGKFAAGNHFGRGNPHARRMAALRQALLATATEDRMRKLGDRLFVAAMAGNWVAAKLYLLLVVGRPSAAVDPDELDLHEYGLLARRPDADEVDDALQKKDPLLAAELAASIGGPKDAEELRLDLWDCRREKIQKELRALQARLGASSPLAALESAEDDEGEE